MPPTTDKSASKKPKLVRDSFTIPKNEFAAIDTLKTRAIALGTSVKKSELLRAGLIALQGLSDAAYKLALAAVPTLKTGRPAADPPVMPQGPKATAGAKRARRAAPEKAPTKGAAKAPAKPAAQAPAKPAAKSAATRKRASAAAAPAPRNTRVRRAP